MKKNSWILLFFFTLFWYTLLTSIFVLPHYLYHSFVILPLQVAKLYEQRQYKKGVKVADALLKKYPTHGETLSMKGLLVSNLGKKQEAYDLVKLGLKYDLKSAVSWHVYGLLYRADHNYPEAIKCYKRALNFNPASPEQILRDLGILQIHLRDVQQNIETRRQLLGMKSSTMMYWLGFAVAHQLAGNNDMALAVLERYESTLDSNRIPNVEDTEVLAYQIELMASLGMIDQALTLINKPWSIQTLVDTPSLLEMRAKLYLAKGNLKEANEIYTELIRINPDNQQYHTAYQTTKQYSSLLITDTSNTQQSTKLHDFVASYIGMLRNHPRCRTLLWILLRCLPSSYPLYEPIARSYIRSTLRKGIPALYTELKQIYKLNHTLNGSISKEESLARRTLFTAIASEAYNTVVSGGTFTVPVVNDTFIDSLCQSLSSNNNNTVTKEDIVKYFYTVAGDNNNEVPSTYPFCTLLYSKLLDAQQKYSESLAVLEKGINHTPTVLELYLAKGKILKHQKQFTDAATAVDEARQLDLADRYLNAKSVKYFLLANNVEKAEEMMALFARHDSKRPNADPLSSIRDVQVVWFELQCGMAFERLGNHNRALKQYLRVVKLFDTFAEDVFDYHMYCLRRGTLRVYSTMMNHADMVRTHNYFFQASIGAARVYLYLHRDNTLLENLRIKAKEAAVTATEKKETVSKNEKASSSTVENEDNDLPDNTGIDTDPEGLKHLEVTSCLDEACKLIQNGVDNLCTEWTLPYHIFENQVTNRTNPKVSVLPWSKAMEHTPENTDKNTAVQMYTVATEIFLEKGYIGASASCAMKALTIEGRGSSTLSTLGAQFVGLFDSKVPQTYTGKTQLIIKDIKDFIKTV